MLKLRRYLKPFAVSILAIIVLLFAQAMCELTMPDYMSNIVNVGINANGIEDGVPEAIREQEYENCQYSWMNSSNSCLRNIMKK